MLERRRGDKRAGALLLRAERRGRRRRAPRRVDRRRVALPCSEVARRRGFVARGPRLEESGRRRSAAAGGRGACFAAVSIDAAPVRL
jgi:hypothetical protein